MRTKVIIIAVAIALLSGLFYRVWRDGYDRGHNLGAQTEIARSEVNAYFRMYLEIRSSMYDPKYEERSLDVIKSDKSNLIMRYDDVKEAANDEYLVGDADVLNTINILESEHSEVLRELNKLIEVKQSHTFAE